MMIYFFSTVIFNLSNKIFFRYTTPSSDYSEDTTITWKVEDTPINFSTATSLSDLSVIDHQSGRFSVDSADGLLEHRRHQRR